MIFSQKYKNGHKKTVEQIFDSFLQDFFMLEAIKSPFFYAMMESKRKAGTQNEVRIRTGIHSRAGCGWKLSDGSAAKAVGGRM